MVRLLFILLVLGVSRTAHAEAQLAGVVPMPAPSSASCTKAPCAAGCSQEVSCNDYDPNRDKCSHPNHVLVNWSCSSPCSCSSDGTVVCSVSYKCVDMVAEMSEIRRLPKPVIHLSKPEAPKEEAAESSPSAEDNDSGDPIKWTISPD